jgi:hypothetical protein
MNSTLLRLLRPGRDAGEALSFSNDGNAALHQQNVAVSMASSHGGFPGYEGPHQDTC